LALSAERIRVEETAEASSSFSQILRRDAGARRDGPARVRRDCCLLDNLSIDSLVTKQNAAEELFRRLGITFAVYAEGGSTERLIPFDLIPRILDRSEWDLVERGCIQRVKAINVFLYDIYHDQEIIKAGLVPPELILLNPAFRPEMLGIEPPNNVYAHIAGIDLIRTGERDFFVLEDNVCTPSGVSYVLENREIMMRLFPDAFAGQSISPVGNYPERLLENLRAVAPSGADDPVVVLLTPGRYNSAYFEHVFLAEQMGIELVEGGDLFVRYGNFIEAMGDTNYFQIGEVKYGKPILDRIIQRNTSLIDAAKCALISFDSTMRSNVSVGPPIDLLIYRRNSLKKDFTIRLEDDDPYLQAIRDGWGGAIHKAFHDISHDPGWTF